ncbi:MAG: hypothetical protein C7B45_10130 [Sulfobacillus acidophilus]|uniref:DUF4015 domain-containing protein n=1 Tax=Sulfobacillus acidophilus TaxID=53633 RepID=A0A2T2WHG5_9FIRM|nr:MAG: hypothetical protein C7B45_10130 [Sulfobacillus acidophilus]
MALGVVSRFVDHLRYFTPAYYEVKDVIGVWRDPVPDAIPMVSIFGDNRLSQRHPDWVQIGPGGERATRSSRYFDWDALCPTKAPVFAQGLAWVKQATQRTGQDIIRLDDVTYAREGFCQCEACIQASRESGCSWTEFRIRRITEFVEHARQLVPRVQMTLYPDPFPGHMEERFGIDVNRLKPYVEAFVVPLYDLHYATTYWVEILAQAFAQRLPCRWYVELYGLEVPEAALLHACQVASAYADGVIIAYDNQLDKLRRIQARLQQP